MKRKLSNHLLTTALAAFALLGVASHASAHTMQIYIEETDPRNITGMQVFVDVWVNGQRYADVVTVVKQFPNNPDFRCSISLDVNAGDNMLVLDQACAPSPWHGSSDVMITQKDTVQYDHIQVSTIFIVDNYMHFDWEAVDYDHNGVTLTLDGRGGTWQGFPGWWVGDFLHH